MTLPLADVLVLDLTRMLPGAVLVRTLVDLGARVVKVEDPAGGDPMRSTPPLVNGTGSGFHVFFRGTESVALDLKTEDGAAALRRLARHADVLLESFRPGTLGRWGLGLDALRAQNPVLVTCSLPAFAPDSADASRVAHDLNLVAASGLLSELAGGGLDVPRVQLADVTTGLLATSAILAALLARHRSGRGAHVDQPLATGPLPFLTWALADASLGEPGATGTLLAGRTPAYRTYACADGRISLGALEPKFWVDLVTALGLPDLAGDGLETGEGGTRAAARLGAVFATRRRADWVALGVERGLPIAPVHTLAEALAGPFLARGLAPAPGAPAMRVPGPWLEGVSRKPEHAAPALGEGTERILREFGVTA